MSIDFYVGSVEKRLSELMCGEGLSQHHVMDAARYSLMSGGKRLRPALCLEFYELFGGNKDITDFACGIEYIQTYSLIHDDLPSMDNDDMRRGKPSCHKAFTEGLAVLAGDALLNGAFELMSSLKTADPGDLLKAIRIFSHCSGIYGMVGGQSVDITCEKYTPESYIEMISMKTSALFEGSCACGAALASACDDDIKRAGDFGRYLGLAFQIRDDVMEGDTGPNSALTVFGEEKCRELIDLYSEKAIAEIVGIEGNGELIRLTDKLKVRNI